MVNITDKSTNLKITHPIFHVLVADDDYFMQRSLILVLNALGHSGVVVNDGKKALECLAQRKCDVLLLDVMMPEMDGLATLAAIRAEEQTTSAYLPIIMVTGYSEPDDIVRLKNAGSDGCVAKPVDLRQLSNALAQIYHR